MITIRVFFSKTDSARYISHLDIVRCFSRSLARTKIPVWYTEGFNPKIHMAFFLPLPLGFKGEKESFDMRLMEDDYPLENVKNLLNTVLPQGLTVTDVTVPVLKADGIVTADYFISVDLIQGVCQDSFNKFLAQDEIIVTKKTKKGTKEIDIRPLFSLVNCAESKESLDVMLNVAAGASVNINPTLIMNSYFQFINAEQCPYRVARTNIYDKDHKEWL